MIRLSGTLANRPAASSAIGAHYLATDENVVYESLGTRWVVREDPKPSYFSGFKTIAETADLASLNSSGMLKWQVFVTETGSTYEAFPTGWYEIEATEGGGDSGSGGSVSLVVHEFSNADSTAADGATVIRQTGTMTDSRELTLPAADTYSDGQTIIITDASGSVSETNRIIITPDGDDTIDGSTDSVTIIAARGELMLISNGDDGFDVSVALAAEPAISNLTIVFQTVLNDGTNAFGGFTMEVTDNDGTSIYIPVPIGTAAQLKTSIEAKITAGSVVSVAFSDENSVTMVVTSDAVITDGADSFAFADETTDVFAFGEA